MTTAMQIGETARDRADSYRCFKAGAAVFLHDDRIVTHSCPRRVGMRAQTGSDRSRLRRSCGSWAFRHAVIVPHGDPVALLDIRFRALSFRLAAVSGIFLAVRRCEMRRISIEIGSSD